MVEGRRLLESDNYYLDFTMLFTAVYEIPLRRIQSRRLVFIVAAVLSQIFGKTSRLMIRSKLEFRTI
jgi:hypothetical protein